jgi:hypothetical protein
MKFNTLTSMPAWSDNQVRAILSVSYIGATKMPKTKARKNEKNSVSCPVETTMAELNDVPQEEIARQIGLSLSGTKSGIQRGCRLLKSMLHECCQSEFDRRGNVVDYKPKAGRLDCSPDGSTMPNCGPSDE